MRLGELAITIITLGAMASTFFLYQDHSRIVSQETATPHIIAKESQTTITRNDGVTTVITNEGNPQKEEQPTVKASAENIATTSVQEESIIIETVPLSQNDKELLQKKIHSLTNLSRSQNNLAPFTLDRQLSSLSMERSIDMIEHSYFSHSSSDGCDLACRFKKNQYNTEAWGENLATMNDYHSHAPDELASEFMGSWLKSSRHRDNILSEKFTHHGIGIASNGNTVIVTVVFAKP